MKKATKTTKTSKATTKKKVTKAATVNTEPRKYVKHKENKTTFILVLLLLAMIVGIVWNVKVIVKQNGWTIHDKYNTDAKVQSYLKQYMLNEYGAICVFDLEKKELLRKPDVDSKGNVVDAPITDIYVYQYKGEDQDGKKFTIIYRNAYISHQVEFDADVQDFY